MVSSREVTGVECGPGCPPLFEGSYGRVESRLFVQSCQSWFQVPWDALVSRSFLPVAIADVVAVEAI